ncbi:hypothetical protein FA13DRAFT_1803503 [Coprinellus micaceus]|uniref:Uncharacterized protein n=1 Tax=Coprinellus micaceus TaxID=71717 RepID=A0A4Y7SAX9_COPMI|nr:hypothetical protein FA13DRAFT_1803503 [Coprinellus micaceus]
MDHANEVPPVASSSRTTEEEPSETPSSGGRRPEPHDPPTSGDVTTTPSTTPAGSRSLSSILRTKAGPEEPSTPSNISPESYATESPPAGTATSFNAVPAP